MTGSATQGIKTVLHPVTDLDKAKAVYTALLGMPPQHDAPYYVGYDTEGQHIGLVPGGASQGMTSPVAYWHVADIEAKLAEVTAAGGDRQGRPARRRQRPPGGHVHRPRRQRPGRAPGPVSAGQRAGRGAEPPRPARRSGRQRQGQGTGPGQAARPTDGDR